MGSEKHAHDMYMYIRTETWDLIQLNMNRQSLGKWFMAEMNILIASYSTAAVTALSYIYRKIGTEGVIRDRL